MTWSSVLASERWIVRIRSALLAQLEDPLMSYGRGAGRRSPGLGGNILVGCTTIQTLQPCRLANALSC